MKPEFLMPKHIVALDSGVSATFGSIAREVTKQETSACNAGAVNARAGKLNPLFLGKQTVLVTGKPFQTEFFEGKCN
jgi:hypothetical protein